MPILKNAKKKLRADARRRVSNKKIKTGYRTVVKKFRATPSMEGLKKAFSALDKAAKKGVIKTGRADRLKSRLSKLVEKSPVKKTVKRTVAKKATKKTAKVSRARKG